MCTYEAKKRAKVLQFSELTKYFLKKMQKIFIFFNFANYIAQKKAPEGALFIV